MSSSIQTAAPQPMIARSYLFVPGDRPDRFDKACSAGADMVLISRLAEIQPPVDGPCTALDDAAQLTVDTRRAKRMGFGGKLCIHPKQVAHVNAAFAPTGDELAWARRVVAAAAESKGAAVALDGRMVDRPVILKAEQIVREAVRRGNKLLS